MDQLRRAKAQEEAARKQAEEETKRQQEDFALQLAVKVIVRDSRGGVNGLNGACAREVDVEIRTI